MKAMIALCSVLLLSGCAADGSASWLAAGAMGGCAKPSSDQELAINLAQGMADEGRLHASLAHLESLPATLPDVRLRKARVLRLLGSSEALPLYQGLLNTCLAAEGEHGLGQLAAARGDNNLALLHLQAAVKLSPTDEKVRNDLGVVYLNQLKLEKARFQFITAMELKQSDSLAALNLVTLLIYQDDWTQAAELVSRTGLTPDQVNAAQARANKLKSAPGSAPVKADKVALASEPAVVISGRQP
jgi:Flp pilus assembly protein TadD